MQRSFGILEWGIVAGIAMFAGMKIFRRPKLHPVTEMERTAQRVAYWYDQFMENYEAHPFIVSFRIWANAENRMFIRMWNSQGDDAWVNMERFEADAPGAICEAEEYLGRKMPS